MLFVALFFAFLSVLSVSLILQAQFYTNKHNESVSELVKVVVESESENIAAIIKTDGELLKWLKETKLSLDVQSKFLDTYFRELQGRIPKAEAVQAPTKTERKKKNVEEFVHTLELAKDRYAVSPFEKNAITGVINRIRETV